MNYEKAHNEDMTRKEAIETIKRTCPKISTSECDFETAMRTLIPELRESEDERIRKLLVWQVYRNIEDETNDLAQSVYDGIKGHDPDLEESIEDWKKCLAYLEKQKESLHIPETCKENADSFTDEDERIRKWLYDFIYNCPNVTFEFYGGVGKDAVLNYLEKQKEQKQEWSDEDERKRQACISTINEVIDYERERWEDYNPGKPYRPIMKYDEQIDWLKSLRPQIIDSKPLYTIEQVNEKIREAQAWSEEDTEMYINVASSLRGYACGLKNEEHKKHIQKGLDWLENRFKSLRPQPKAELTLLDENIIEAAVAFVEQNDHFNVWRGIDKHTVLKALRSLKPHWKPSKEQMRVLSWAANGMVDKSIAAPEMRAVLRELYEQLKKLGVKEEPEYYQHFDPDC